MSCVLPENMAFQGLQCMGGGGKKGIHTSFYPSGKLKSFFSPTDVKINGVLCKGGVFDYISLAEDGFLKRCKLGKDQMINGKTYKKNSVLAFDNKMNILRESQ